MARRKPLDVSFGAKRVNPEDTLESGLPREMRNRPKGERRLAVKPSLLDYARTVSEVAQGIRPENIPMTGMRAGKQLGPAIGGGLSALYDYARSTAPGQVVTDVLGAPARLGASIRQNPSMLYELIPGSGTVQGIREGAQRLAEGDPEAMRNAAALAAFAGAMDVIPGGGKGANLAVKGAKELAEEGVDLAAREVVRPQGIIAYHGSPHSFERFDISKIGTGEGAQAYGHGLYFAEAEPVAAEYRQRLANVTAAPFDVIGIPPKEWNAALMFARQMDPTQPDVAARDFAQWVGRDVTPELVDAFRVAREPGNMYQVKLNVRPEDLLDWDRPISTQSDIVQRAAREADIGHLKPGSKYRVMMDWFREGTEQPHNLVKGRDLMMALDQSLGNNFTPEVSSQLSQFGIPGIQYLDEKSRPLGEGTRNYVMFDDALIDLLRKYAEGGFVTPLSVR